MTLLIATPAASPLQALTPAAVVAHGFRTDSWGEVRSAEAEGSWEKLSLAAWRYLWTERSEAEVHHIATALLKVATCLPGVVTQNGQKLAHRWPRTPTSDVRGLLLDPRLGWGLVLPETALSRAENLAWLDEVLRQIQGPRQEWTHAWTRDVCPQEAELLARLDRGRSDLAERPLTESPLTESALLMEIMREAWTVVPNPRPDRHDFAEMHRATPHLSFRRALREGVPDPRTAPWSRFGIGSSSSRYLGFLASRYLKLMRAPLDLRQAPLDLCSRLPSAASLGS